MKKLILATLVLAGCSQAKYELKPKDGVAGSSCTTTQLSNGAIIKCTDGSTSVVYNGSNGTDGVDGSNGANGIDGADSILEVVNPCGENFSNDEVFLRLSSGRLLALYDGGANLDRLTLIAPGNYITTDSTRYCKFTVTEDYKIINEVVY